jgi:HTH-type transcriptional regulator, sugar sensing transcriptional regulator
MELTEDLRVSLPEILKSLGFTKYEALVYVALLGMEAGTATEIHELSRVPRASVYPVLDRLVEKNLVAVSHATPRRYSALPPEKGIDNLLARIEEDARRAKEVLAEIHRQRVSVERGDQELIWSIHGEEKIITHLRDLVAHARSRIQVMSHWPLVRKILLEDPHAVAPRVQTEVICNEWEGEVPAGMTVHARDFGIVSGRHAELPPHDLAGIFIIDGEKAMVIMGVSDEVPTALLSESPGFLRFFSQIWSLNLAWATRKAR